MRGLGDSVEQLQVRSVKLSSCGKKENKVSQYKLVVYVDKLVLKERQGYIS